jgi:hypothetical protein
VLPIGVAADSAGAIWVADTYNHRIQCFAPPGDVCGRAAGGGSSDGGVTAPAPAPPPQAAAVARRRLAPLSLRLRVSPQRDRRAPYWFTVTGRLARPAGVSAADGCRGRVSVRVGRRERVVALRRDCTLRVVVRLPRSTRRERLRVRATFTGNAALEARAARSVLVRVG